MWVYRLIWAVTTPFMKLFWLKKATGMKEVPKSGGVIIAPNHQSWYDHYFLTSTLAKRRLYFLIGEFNYKKPHIRWALDKMGHIKVNRYTNNKKEVYERAAEILASGGALVVFPEGRLSTDGKLQKGFRGVAKMAQDNKVDIVPAVIKDSYNVFPLHRKKPHFGKDKKCVEVKYLPRIKYEDFKDKTHEQIVHDMIMKEIAAELGHDYNHQGFEKDIKKDK
jgi:1-acyl-sn-glycerol-3-phosphate acyltransferase